MTLLSFYIIDFNNHFTQHQTLKNSDLICRNLKNPRIKISTFSMFPTKPTSRFILFTLSLLLLLSFFTTTTIVNASDLDDEVDTDFEELLALDEQEDQEQQGSQGDGSAKSEAEVLSKAQRIVLELNSDNVKRVIDGAEFVLVLGYAPWCPRSAELMPKFAEAATLLKELKSPLLMAKLDADRHTKAASMLDIKGFPTLLLFVNGTSQPYTGGFSTEEIVIWARKKTGVPVIRISSVNEAEGFLKKYHTFVLGTFDKFEGPDYIEFVKSAASDNEIQFVETSNTEVAKVLFPDIKTAKQFLGIVKSEPERYTEYGEITDIWGASRPYEAEITVKSLLVNNFYVGEGSDSTGVPTKMLTVNGSLKISVYNPATLFGIHVSSTPVNLVYSEVVVATGQLKKYYQPRKSHRTVLVNLEGNKVPLYGAGSSLSVNSQTGGEVPLTLKFEIKSKGEVVGRLVKTTHKKQVSCPLNIDILSTKPIKFKKSSCTYL